MRKSLFILLAFFSLTISAQQQKSDSLSKNYDKNAFYKPGETKLHREFYRALSYAVDQNYLILGEMTFALYIDDTGLAKIIDINPKVKNYQPLMDDLNYVLKKTHKNWEPAQKNNIKVSSIYYYKIAFNTEVYDHD